MGKFGQFLRNLVDVEEDVYDEYDVDNGYEQSYEEEYVEETPYTDYQEETFVDNTQTVFQQPIAAPVTPVSAATVIMLTPYDIRTSQIVCDHIREGHIVICNLTPNTNNQRVVDYISGAVYALDGKIEPTPVKTTFVCTPKNVDLIVDSGAQAETGTKVSAL